MMELFDERAEVPVRARIGTLLRGATTADFAFTRIRLGALDLQREEVEGLERCRVLLGAFDATALQSVLIDRGEPEQANPVRISRLRVLRSFVESGRLEVRSAGLARWTPDFGVVGGKRPRNGGSPPGRATHVAVIGANHFGPPHHPIGPSFTAITGNASAVKLLAMRFEETWAHGHDVLPAIRDVVLHTLEAVHGPR